MEIVKAYPLDAVYDSPEDVPEDVIFLSIIFFCLAPNAALWQSFLFLILGQRKQKVCWVIKLDC